MGNRECALEGLVMNQSFWKSKKVLVTGHTGFKGSWLCLWLSKMGADVVGYSLDAPTEPNLFSVANVASGITSVYGDVRNLDELMSVVSTNQVEIIFHLAAQSLVKAGYKNPVDTYATNVMGTVNVFEVARKVASVKCVLNVTSDKCYENKDEIREYKETEPFGGKDPYSNSKACSELVTYAYRHSFFTDKRIAIASARAGNVIGGGDWADYRLVPDVVRSMFHKSSIKIRNPEAVRPWQHVLEPISGYLKLVSLMWEDADNFNEGWNFGPSDKDSRSVRWLLGKIGESVSQTLGWESGYSSNEHHEAQYLQLDSSKANQRLGWYPKLSIDDAVKWTMEWYERYFNDEDMREFTLNQIGIYTEQL